MSNQELAMQLCQLKGTLESLLDIIPNAAMEDNKREANRSWIDKYQDSHESYQQNSNYNEFLEFKRQK
uniref:Uncharacterized protein n=1 Tax=Romanomermis culicivorax TaxID=13658 RepID=A0A915INM3_ROMCU